MILNESVMKKSSKYIIIVSIVLLMIPIYKVFSCAGGDEDYIYSLFAPETSNAPDYEPFFFIPNRAFYTYDDDTINTFEKYNIKEWKAFFDNKISVSKLNELVYITTLEEVGAYIGQIKFGKFPAALKPLPDDAKTTSFLQYLQTAKNCESWSSIYANTDDWELKVKTVDNSDAGKLLSGLKENYQKEKNTFLKQRYAYQILRMYFYTLQYQKCVDWFNANSELNTKKDYIYYMSLRYVGGAYYRSKNYGKANYTFALLFDNFLPSRKEAMTYFHPQEQADWQQTLALAKNDKEKAGIWNLFGYYADPLTAMENIYKLDANSSYLSPMLTRVINILENYNLADDSNYDYVGDGYKDAQKLGTQKDITKARVFVEKCITERKIKDVAFWQTSLSYLQFMEDDFTASLKTIESIDYASIQKDKLLVGQLKINKLLSTIAGANLVDAALEQKIYSDFKWLSDGIYTEAYPGNSYRVYPENVLRKGNAFSYCLRLLAAKYKKQSDVIKTELCEVKTAFYNSNNQLEKMIKYQDAPHTDFEKILINIYPYHKKDLVEQWAINLAYDGNINGAIEMINLYPDAGKDTLYGNPFNGRINDCHDCDHEAFQKTKYSKLSFLKKMIEMDAVAKANPKEAATNYYLLGNAYYNMTYFGNARRMHETTIQTYYCCRYVYYSFENGKDSRDDLKAPFYNCDKAAIYYIKAMDASTDKNFKAKCCWMLAKCEMNDYYETSDFIKNREKVDFKSGKYYKKMKTEFSDTKYYADVIKQCGYFNTYVNL